jgi:hypothetical protein
MPAGTWGEWTGEPDPVTGYVQPPPEPTLALAGNPSTEEALAKQRQRDEARLRSGQLLVGAVPVQANAADRVQSTGRLAERGPADDQVSTYRSGVQGGSDTR